MGLKLKLHITEIFDLVKKARDNQEKIKVLKENDSSPLRQILYAAFSDRVKFLLPDGAPNFKRNKSPVGLGDSSLMREARRLYLFTSVNGKPMHPTLSQMKRENIWVQILEGLPAEEADFLELLKSRTVGKEYELSKPLVVRSFPILFTSEEVAAESVVMDDRKPLVQALEKASNEPTIEVPMAPIPPVRKKRGPKPKPKGV